LRPRLVDAVETRAGLTKINLAAAQQLSSPIKTLRQTARGCTQSLHKRNAAHGAKPRHSCAEQSQNRAGLEGLDRANEG
jgi:hypothetical protein